MLPQAGLPGLTSLPLATGANMTLPWNRGLLSIVTLPCTGASSRDEWLQPGIAATNTNSRRPLRGRWSVFISQFFGVGDASYGDGALVGITEVRLGGHYPYGRPKAK